MRREPPVGGGASRPPLNDHESPALAASPIHLLHRAGQCADIVFQNELTDGDLTPRQLAVLTALGEFEGVSQTALVVRTGIDRSTLADIVRRMQRKGLVQRRRTKEDARAYAVRLTEDGRKLLRASEPLSRRAEERVLAAIPPKNRELFLDSLAAIVQSLHKPAQGA